MSQFCCPECGVCKPTSQAGKEGFQKGSVDLTDQNPQLDDGTTWIIMLSAPWCGHCKNASPTFLEFAYKFPVRVGKIDCDANPQLASKFKARGFPMFIMYRGGKWKEHKGPRTVDSWMEFAQTPLPQ